MAYRSKPIYLLSPANPTPEIQDAMDSFLGAWLQRHELTEGCQLYHYTTLKGLQGILTNRALWCSHSSSLNDPLEIQYGQEIVANILSDFMKKEDREDLRAFLRSLLVEVQAFGKAMFHTFVACFCESGNLLSQWRGYADKGGGYCVGLEFSSSTQISPDLESLGEGKHPFLRRVIYDKDEQQELVLRYVGEVTQAAKIALDGGIAAQFTDMPTYPGSVMAMQAANVLLDMMLSFKHPAFASEEEWRLVRVTMESHQPEKLCFRETSSGLIPYRPTHIYDFSEDKKPTFPLRSIGFGPMLEPVRTRSAVELLVHHIAADNHPIILTPHIPIRGPGYNLR